MFELIFNPYLFFKVKYVYKKVKEPILSKIAAD